VLIIELSERLQEAVECMLRLLDVKSCIEAETALFKDLSHDELCKAFEYWFEQTKMVFGEPVWITQNQSLRDSGVDVLIDLLSSRIHFGIQIKSYNDIEDNLFSKNVNAQISQSHRHDLTKLIVGFAGDLADKRNKKNQKEKIRGLTSEIHQQKGDSNYVFVLSPEKVLTIYKIFNGMEHPLKHVLLENKDAIILAKGIAKSLSNEKRNAKVNIEIEYPRLEEDKVIRPHSFKLEYNLNENSLDVVDRIEHLPITGDYVKLNREEIDNLKIVDVKTGTTFSPTELFVWSDNNPMILVNMKTISETGNILSSVEKYVFRITKNQNELRLIPVDQRHPLYFELIFIIGVSTAALRTKCHISYGTGEEKQRLEGIEFIKSFTRAKKLQCFNCNTGETYVYDIANVTEAPD